MLRNHPYKSYGTARSVRSDICMQGGKLPKSGLKRVLHVRMDIKIN
jgi:hypothetical protein